jgi:hypothetical protein
MPRPRRGSPGAGCAAMSALLLRHLEKTGVTNSRACVDSHMGVATPIGTREMIE